MNEYACPHCDADLRGEEIPKEIQQFYGTTHFSRAIGLEYPERYDGIWEWKCPDCKETWPSEVQRLAINEQKKGAKHEPF